MRFGARRYGPVAPDTCQFGKYEVRTTTGLPISSTVKLMASMSSRMFVTFAGKVLPFGGETLNWLVAGMLIVALALSALNAIMGSGRSLHQMSVDGQFPRWFQHLNHHGVPDRDMRFLNSSRLV